MARPGHPRTYLRAAVRNAEVAADRSGSTAPAVHLLSFAPDDLGRRGRMAIGFRPVDTAPTVHWHAYSATSAAAMYDMPGRVAGLHAETTRTHPDDATVVWMDYDSQASGDCADRLRTATSPNSPPTIPPHSRSTYTHPQRSPHSCRTPVRPQ